VDHRTTSRSIPISLHHSTAHHCKSKAPPFASLSTLTTRPSPPPPSPPLLGLLPDLQRLLGATSAASARHTRATSCLTSAAPVRTSPSSRAIVSAACLPSSVFVEMPPFPSTETQYWLQSCVSPPFSL
ncbi:hypothetical protein U1Q18_031343, partial [Sarracenia purpurea var. burkii]